ncbi:unnamed protein product [Hymenolepis diminuta]|uniref:SAM domain-containing protein n=1 Tax=Hymenolepis diminuta TaxID=6216 RepID=A0A0R3SKU9_HYMDI|nr:unnamed protein product [Hymenolepis diminuta]
MTGKLGYSMTYLNISILTAYVVYSQLDLSDLDCLGQENLGLRNHGKIALKLIPNALPAFRPKR